MKKNVIKTVSWIFFLLIILAAGVYWLRIQSTKPEMILSGQTTDTVGVNMLLTRSYVYFNKQDRSGIDLDSSMLIIDKAYEASRRLNFKKGIGKCLDAYSKIYSSKRDTLVGRLYADSSIAVFKENNFLYELGDAYYNRSGYCPMDSKLLNQRIEWVKLALATHEKSGSKISQANLLKELGDLQQYNSEFDDAVINLEKSIVLYKAINYSIGAIGAYDLLGDVVGSLGNYRLAVKYGLLALKESAQLTDSSYNSFAVMTTIHNRIGLNYERMGKYKLAYQHYDKGYHLSLRSNNVESKIILAYNRAKALSFVGNTPLAIQYILEIPKKELDEHPKWNGSIHALLMIFHLKIKNLEKSRAYSQPLLADYAYAKKMGTSSIHITKALTKYYLAINELDKAEVYLKENESIFSRHKLIPDLADVYREWTKLDSARRDLNRYIAHTRQYQVLRDSTLNQQNNQEIAQLQIEYETEKKDKNIALLNAESKIQVTNLKQAMLVRNVTIGGVVLLIIIVVLLYNRYQFKNRINLTISQKNANLNQLVTEKEWLLKEIHHRVKNNLQIIISLLDSQSMYLQDNAALSAIRDSQSRVHCMSLIHKKLYQSESIATIDMKVYIKELVDYLSSAFGVQETIRFELSIDELYLNTSQSIPIGLILNEAITNSIKYAFPQMKATDKISIQLSAISNRCRLTIADNGIGLPAGFSEESIKSLGVSLMKGLSEDIDATFSIKDVKGTCVEILFMVSPVNSLLELPDKLVRM